MAVEVGGLEPFQVKGEPHSISQCWRKWKRANSSYTCLEKGSRVTHRNVAFYFTRPVSRYKTFVPDGENKDYPTTLNVLEDDCFIPKANVPFERNLFRQITQTNEETIDQFVCQLKQRAASCDFGGREDEYIRDQLIDKCYSAKLRRKFLEKDGSVTLNDLLKTARAQEAVDLQMVSMGGNANSEHVNNVTDTGLNRNVDRRSCFNCGRDDHFARDRRCPARGCKCDQCGEIGHFKVKCRRGTSQNFQQWERRGITSGGKKVEPKITDSGKKTNTNYVDGEGDRSERLEQDERPSTGPEYVFSVGDDTRQSN